MSHGGKRKGAGRPQGSAKGREATTVSITMHNDLWGKLDKIRGEDSRSAFLAKKIKGMRAAKNTNNQ